MIKKLAIISTHPIQYYAPVFQLLAKSIDLKVFYTWGESSLKKYDQGFKKQVEWDLPLLDGYNYEFLNNTAKDKGTHHFNGIVNPDLIEQVSDFKPNAILVYGWAWQSHFKAIRFFKGKVPVYFRGDSTLFNNRFGLKSIVKSLFLKWVYRHVDFAFNVGSANKAYFKKYGLKDSQLIFAPHAIDNNRFAEDKTREVGALRQQLGVSDEDILILFAGKFEKVKNPELLLNAFIELIRESEDRSSKSELKSIKSKVQRQNSEVIKTSTLVDQTVSPLGDVRRTGVHLLFAGNGELEESLKLRVKNLSFDSLSTGQAGAQDNSAQDEKSHLKSKISNLRSQIHFMDFQNQTQMPVIYQACDLFCLPSLSETWGLAVNEAMACEKAILVSNRVGCATDLVKQNINGAIFESNNLNDLTDKLKFMCKDKTQLVAFGQQSKNIIQDWSFQHQVESITNTICKK